MAAGSASAPVPVPSVAASRATYRLRIESQPPNAIVVEDGAVLGTTPLELATPTSGEARARAFGLRKTGYVDAYFTESSAEGNVARLVVLTPLPSAPPASTLKPSSAPRSLGALEIRKER